VAGGARRKTFVGDVARGAGLQRRRDQRVQSLERGAGAQVGLNVIAAAFGVMAVAVGLAIHRRSPISPWLVLGVIPGLIGIWLTFG
jgi:hypothetical protein